jgi:hypothetical protein
MLLWIFLIIGWAAVLIAGISLCRIAAYADQKMRRTATRLRSREHQAAS